MARSRKQRQPRAKSRKMYLAARVLLAVTALSLGLLAARKGNLARLYFSPPVQLAATVARAELTDAVPTVESGPRAGTVSPPIPTRLALRVNEHQDLRFEVALRSDPGRLPVPPRAGERVTLTLPGRWPNLVTDGRVLAFGVAVEGTVIVDAKQYPYTAEYRTAFLAAAAAAGALVAALGAWRLGRG